MKGGKRKGSGRPKAEYKTKTIAFRVKEDQVETIKQTVKQKIIELNEKR